MQTDIDHRDRAVAFIGNENKSVVITPCQFMGTASVGMRSSTARLLGWSACTPELGGAASGG